MSLLLIVNVDGNVAFKKAIFWRVALTGLLIPLQLPLSPMWTVTWVHPARPFVRAIVLSALRLSSVSADED